MNLLRRFVIVLGALWAFGCGTAWSAEIAILSSVCSASYTEAGQAAVSELVRAGVKRSEITQLVTSEMVATDWSSLQGAGV